MLSARGPTRLIESPATPVVSALRPDPGKVVRVLISYTMNTRNITNTNANAANIFFERVISNVLYDLIGKSDVIRQ